MEPSALTWAAQPARRETSRSVAESRSSPPCASASTLERMGIEFFRSTIPCTSWSSFTKSLLRTLISIVSALSRPLSPGRSTDRGKRCCANVESGASHNGRKAFGCGDGCGCPGGERARAVDEGQPVGPARARRGPLCGKAPESHRNACTKLLISLSKSGSRLRMVSILRTEWITVEWCFPPKSLPISGSEALVRVLVRYMAIWRGSATDLELFLALSSVSFTL